jgi:hypothetical protein
MGNKLIIYFPPAKFSGHEKMAIRIIKLLNKKITCFCNFNNANSVSSIGFSKFITYKNRIKFIILIFYYRFLGNKNILLISGSPYGLMTEKFLLYFLGYRIFEYTAFPELVIMRDRFHHNYIPYLNRLLISCRILIDDWQVQYSSVKNNIVIKNIC